MGFTSAKAEADVLNSTGSKKAKKDVQIRAYFELDFQKRLICVKKDIRERISVCTPEKGKSHVPA